MDWIRGLFGPEREGKRLAKDARWIVSDMDVVYGAERMQQVAQMTRERLRDCHATLERSPERRAEVIRDVALVSSEMLDPKMGGEGVKPYQPAGMWAAMWKTW